MAADAVRLTTRELSVRTFPDFEQFFSQVHGCACTLYFFGRHLTPAAGTAKERAERLGAPDRSLKHFPHKEWMRARELSAVKELVQSGQAHGILVYADGEPVGWCHFGRAEELPLERDDTIPEQMFARHPSTQWRITCFTTRADYRRRGVASKALKAAVAAIRKRGGGWIEATPMAFPHNDPMVRKLRKTFGWKSPQVTDYLRDNWPSKEVAGVGQVNACLTTSQSMGHMGTMSMFEKLGFTATGRDELRSTDDPRYPWHFVVMRLKV
jgi:GNAT superfamily N-acetyltransferase